MPGTTHGHCGDFDVNMTFGKTSRNVMYNFSVLLFSNEKVEDKAK